MPVKNQEDEFLILNRGMAQSINYLRSLPMPRRLSISRLSSLGSNNLKDQISEFELLDLDQYEIKEQAS